MERQQGPTAVVRVLWKEFLPKEGGGIQCAKFLGEEDQCVRPKLSLSSSHPRALGLVLGKGPREWEARFGARFRCVAIQESACALRTGCHHVGQRAGGSVEGQELNDRNVVVA